MNFARGPVEAERRIRAREIPRDRRAFTARRQLEFEPLSAEWEPGNWRTTDRVRARRERERGFKSFVSRHGWRLLALPLLTALTVWVVINGLRSGADPQDQVLADPRFGQLSPSVGNQGVIGAPPSTGGNLAVTLPAGALPAGGAFTPEGTGTWHVVPGSSEQFGTGAMTLFTYSVDIEDGVDTDTFGGDEAFAAMVDATLRDPKSWTNDKRFAFQRVDHGDATFHISLTSPATTRRLCGSEIEIETSCFHSNVGRVVLNEARWVRGALPFQGDIGSYRQYQINHEVGHAIGYHEHQPCDVEDGLAPILMQQTFGTGNNEIARLDPVGVVPMDGKTCRYNPWPYPRG